MLFERRCYTLRPGATAALWRAQAERGFELVRPVQERLIGWFGTVDGPREEVVHLYRFDGFDDWRERLHGLYAVEALEPYFAAARALLTAQLTEFLVPAPPPELTPAWSGGRDWRPGAPSPLRGASAASLVEERSTVLLPGTAPRYWAAWREAHEASGDEARGGRGEPIATFATLVGRLHRIVGYTHHRDADAWHDARARRLADPAWRRFDGTVAPWVVSDEARALRPAPLRELSPFLRAGDAGD